MALVDPFIIRTEVTSEYLDKIESQLSEIIIQRLLNKRRRAQNNIFYTRIRPMCLVALRILGVLIVILTSWLTAIREYLGNSIFLNVAAISLGIASIWLAKNGQRMDARLAAFYRRIIDWSSKLHSRTMLKHARRVAPFVAEYTYASGKLVYRRIKNEKTSDVWQRAMTGFLVSGNGFTVWFKSESDAYPIGIALHDTAQPITEYLVQLAVQRNN
jgi:hypothetical protein